MNRSLEAAIEAARSREAPWDVERSARIERRIVARRVDSAMAARFTRWAIGGLASAALYASLIHVSRLSREPDLSGARQEEAAPAPADTPVDDPSLTERPIGDGGFD